MSRVRNMLVLQGSAENSLSFSLVSQYARVRMCNSYDLVKVTQGYV